MEGFYITANSISPMALMAFTAGFFAICYIAATIKEFINR